MKGILKLLAIFGLTAPLAVNVVACGNGNSSDTDDEVSENAYVQELLKKAKEQISLGLANLISEYKNLTFEDEFGESGKDITNNLNSLSKDSDTLVDSKIKDIFLTRLQKDITNLIIEDYLLQPSDLKPLFNNITTSEILKIDFNETIMTNKQFNWTKENADFGIENYDPATYNITMWYKLAADLKLKLSYKDESNKKTEIEVSNIFDFNYANTGANLKSLIEASTGNVTKVLKDFIIEIGSTTTDSESLLQKAKELIARKLNNNKVNITKVDINAQSEVLQKNDVYASGDHMYEALTKSTIDEAIDSLKNYLSPTATAFSDEITKWLVGKQGVPEESKNKINAFGKITISDWSISGLRLTPMTLDFINISPNQTQGEWAEQTATALGKIFYTKSKFAEGRIDITTDNNLTIYMNPGDFDNFVQKNKTMSDISDYISSKISSKATIKDLIKGNISVTLNGLWKGTKNPTLSDRTSVKKVDDNTFKVKRNAGGMHGYNYLTIRYANTNFLTGMIKNNKNNHILFDNWIIKKADTDVW